MKRVAAVDIGTNSVRLLVADVDGTSPRDAKRRAPRPAHAHHAARPGRRQARALAPEAIERTLAVLREYRAALDELGVDAVRATATSAARDSANRDEFFTAAHDALGVDARAAVG